MPRMKKITSAAAFLLLVLFAAVFLSSPARFGQSVLNGLMLWLTAIVPTALPLLVVLSLMVRSPAFLSLTRRLSPFAEKLFRIPGAGAGAMLLSLLSGYPAGARTVAELVSEGRLQKGDVFYTACLASTSGPAFCLGAAAAMFGSPAAGMVLFGSHLLAVWSAGFLLPRLTRHKANPAPPPLPKAREPFSALLISAVQAVLSVGALIALFFCLKEMLFSILPPLSGYGEGVLSGLLEVTAGVSALANLKTPLSLALAAAEVSFGGLCVNAQQLSFLAGTGVKMLPFLLVKCAHGLLAFAFCYPLALLVFPV
mgnify:FL=1